MDPENPTLSTVHRGDLTELLPLQAALNAHGLHAFIADQNIKTIDPFITGGSIFQTRLQVPSYEVEQALAVIEDLRHSKAEAENSAATDEPPGPGVSAGRLETFGLRLRWSAVLVGFLAPFPLPALISLLVYGIASFRYILLTVGRSPKPAGHVFTLASISLVVAVCLISIVFYRKSPFQ